MRNSTRLNFHGAKERLERALIAIESGTRPPDEVAAVFRERAKALARPLESESQEQGVAILVFRLGNSRYAVPLDSVTEVGACPPVAPVPGASPGVVGLIQMRGEIRVVMDLGKLMGLDKSPPPNDLPTVMLLRSAERGETGVLVEEIEDIRISWESERQPAEKTQHGMWMTDDLVTVLNVENLLPGQGGVERS